MPEYTNLLMRHPESVQNASGLKVFDSGDPELSKLGHRQGHAAGVFLQQAVRRGLRLEAIIVSPAKRALIGGLIIQRYLPDVPLETDSRLKEVNWGDWSGRLQHEVMTKDVQTQADAEGLAFCPPNGESMLDAYEDFQAAREDYAGYDTLMVSHGFKIKSLIGGQLSLDRQAARKLPVGNAELLRFQPLPNVMYAQPELAIDRLYTPKQYAA